MELQYGHTVLRQTLQEFLLSKKKVGIKIHCRAKTLGIASEI
jgi:hypothetical protein